MSARARNFAVANEGSPIVYGSVDGNRVTYRLADGKMFNLNAAEARQIRKPRWAYLEDDWNSPALKAHEREERETLRRVQAEALNGEER